MCPCGCSSGSGSEGPPFGGGRLPLTRRRVVGVGTCPAFDHGAVRRHAEGPECLSGTPRWAGLRPDDSSRHHPKHPRGRSCNPVAHAGTCPGGRKIHPADRDNRHTEESKHPAAGGSGLDLSGRGLLVGLAPPMPAAVTAAGAGIAAAEARAAAAAGPTAKAGAVAAAGMAAAGVSATAAVGPAA